MLPRSETPVDPAPNEPPVRGPHTAKRVLPGLTSLRFFAALHVLLFHFARPQFAAAPESVRNLIGSGHVGVSFFFILSGFILFYNYSVPPPRKAFWAARFARIYPVYALGLVVAAPAFVAHLAHSGALSELPKFALVKFGLLQAWIPEMALPWNGPGWSLSCEAFFYLLFPFLIPAIARMSRRQAIATAIAMALLTMGKQICFLWGTPFLHDQSPANPILHLPLFLLGAALARAYPAERRIRGNWPLVFFWGGLMALLGFLMSVRDLDHWFPSSFVLAATFSLIITGAALAPDGSLSLLAAPFAFLLGEASYALYILHDPLAGYAQFVSARIGMPFDSPAVFWLYCLVTIGLSVLVFRYFERPMNRALRARLGRAR